MRRLLLTRVASVIALVLSGRLDDLHATPERPRSATRYTAKLPSRVPPFAVLPGEASGGCCVEGLRFSAHDRGSKKVWINDLALGNQRVP